MKETAADREPLPPPNTKTCGSSGGFLRRMDYEQQGGTVYRRDP